MSMSYPDFSDLTRVQEDINQFPYDALSAPWVDICEQKCGSCSNYVIGKKHQLMFEYGWPVQTLRIGIVMVEPARRLTGETHAVLVIDDEHVLDQRQMAVSSVGGLARIGYEPVSIQAQGDSVKFVEWFWK